MPQLPVYLMTVSMGKGATIRIPVYILQGPRRGYGRLDYLVRPVGGEGTVWVSTDKAQFVPDAPEVVRLEE